MPHRVRARSGGISPTSARPFVRSIDGRTRPTAGPETSPVHGPPVGAVTPTQDITLSNGGSPRERAPTRLIGGSVQELRLWP